jgi:hypothetical protein
LATHVSRDRDQTGTTELSFCGVSIDGRRSKADFAAPLQGCTEAIRFFVGELTIFLGPLGKGALQLAYTIRALPVERSLRFRHKQFDLMCPVYDVDERCSECFRRGLYQRIQQVGSDFSGGKIH